MDDVFERASGRRAALQERRKKLHSLLGQVEAELKELDSFFAVAARFGAGAQEPTPQELGMKLSSLVNSGRWQAAQPWPGSATDGASLLSSLMSGTQSVPHGSKTRIIVGLARDIIKEHGPLSARRILELIDQSGAGEALIPGRDLKGRISYVSAVLSKDGQFESDRDAGGYMLKKEEAPPTEGQEGPDDNSDLL